MKKFFSALMAMSMAMALAIPAFASQTETLEYEASTQAPTINIEMPSAASVILNPYKMEVTLSDGKTKLSDQIVSPTACIKNTSDIGLKVNVTYSAVVGGDVQVVSDTKTDITKSTDKLVKLELTLGTVTKGDGSVAPTGTALLVTDSEQSLYDATATKPTDNRISLAAASDKAPNYLGIKLSGAAVAQPTEPWTENDTVGATLVFEFTPVANAGA